MAIAWPDLSIFNCRRALSPSRKSPCRCATMDGPASSATRPIDHRAAVAADLELEAALGGGGHETERRAAACSLRQQRYTRLLERVLALGALQRLGHAR